MIDIENTRLILFHKHPVSARMHFVYFQHGGVCAFKPLPKLATLRESGESGETESVLHPAVVSGWGERQLELESGVLQAETEYCEKVEVPRGEITVYLSGFIGHEVPDKTLAKFGANMVTLMECVGIAPVEMLLLQKAYRVIMGG